VRAFQLAGCYAGKHVHAPTKGGGISEAGAWISIETNNNDLLLERENPRSVRAT
jgi:hypothetical protein